MYYCIYVHGGKTTYRLSKFNHTILRHLKTNKQKQNRFKIFNSFYRNLLKQQRIKCVQLDFLCVTCFLPVMDKSLLPPAYCEEPEVISQTSSAASCYIVQLTAQKRQNMYISHCAEFSQKAGDVQKIMQRFLWTLSLFQGKLIVDPFLGISNFLLDKCRFSLLFN